jgi:hypothetical protein
MGRGAWLNGDGEIWRGSDLEILRFKDEVNG